MGSRILVISDPHLGFRVSRAVGAIRDPSGRVAEVKAGRCVQVAAEIADDRPE